AIGAHPGFPDLQGFGRRPMTVPLDSLGNMVRYQIGAAQAVARANGTRIRHVKLHGALANMAAGDRQVALACFQAALSVDPGLIIVAMATTAQQAAVQELGCCSALEIFADRAYNPDGSLVNRREPGAVIHDPDAISRRVAGMLKAGAIIAADGTRIATPIDTVCLHGDTASAAIIARRVRATLQSEGIELAPFQGQPVS
ncbi:MAG: 5-oxoprolinase subunit PxpA, partial [Leisingera sp.]